MLPEPSPVVVIRSRLVERQLMLIALRGEGGKLSLPSSFRGASGWFLSPKDLSSLSTERPFAVFEAKRKELSIDVLFSFLVELLLLVLAMVAGGGGGEKLPTEPFAPSLV